MQVSTIPVVSIKGDAFSRGQQLGSQTAYQIRRGIEFYLGLWKSRSGMDKDYVLGQAAEFVPIIGEYDPEILEELRGVVEGAGVSLEEVIALNARYEFVWAKLEDDRRRPTECTSFGAGPKRVAGGHTLIGQNWDYLSAVEENCVITEIYQEGRPNVVFHGEAGVIGQKGMNSAGLGLCVNALISDHDAFKPAVPFFVIARAVLNSTTLDEAKAAVARAQRAVSGNMLLGSDTGKLADLELTPVDVQCIEATDGGLSHANNFEALGPHRNVADKWDRLLPSMKERPARAHDILNEAGSELEVESFKALFKDHNSETNPICLHPKPSDPDDLRSHSVVSMIMDLNERAMYIAEGPPCANEYRRLTFDSLTG